MKRPFAGSDATLYAGVNKKRAGKTTIYFIVLAVAAFIMSACSTTEHDSGIVPAAPTTGDWAWTTVGYTDPGSDSAVEVVGEDDAEEVTVSGTGSDIFGMSDEFVFAYRELHEDGSLQALLQDFDSPAEWSKAGIMIRESLDPGAQNVLVHISGNNGAVLQARSYNSSDTEVIAWDPARSASSVWLRLSRTGNNILAELSNDGIEWEEFSTHEFEASGPVLIGFAVAANAASDGLAAVARFSEIRRNLEQSEPPSPAPSPSPTPTPPTPPAPPAPPTPAPDPEPGDPGDDLGFDLPEATLFVSPQGNAGNSGRTADEPTTLRRAAEIARAGDVIYLRGGEYPVNVNFRQSGTQDQPIIWASHPGEWAILDGSSLTPGSARDQVSINGVQWNIFANFEVRHSPQQGILLDDSHHNRFIRIVTHGNHGSGMQLINSDSNSIEFLVTYDNYDRYNNRGEPGQDADGIGISSGDGNAILNCVSYFNSDDGVDLWRGTNSLVDGCISFANGRGAYGNGNGFKLGASGSASNSTVVRSISFNNQAAGFHSNGGSGITVTNNTAYDNGSDNFVGTSSTTFRNNISESGRASMNGGTGFNNSWNLGITDSGFASTEPSNALFLSLSEGSAARNVGVNVDLDLDFSGSVPDLGALQFPHVWADALDNPLFDMDDALAMIE